MKREISRFALGALVSAAWYSTGLAAPSVIFDLRAESSNPKFVNVANVGDPVTIDVVALVAGSDASTANDGFGQVIANFATSNATATGSNLRGNLDNLTFAPSFPVTASGPGSRQPPIGDFDSDGDYELGQPGGPLGFQNKATFDTSDNSNITSNTTEIVNGKTYSHFDLGKFTFIAGGGYTSTSYGTATGPGGLSLGQATTVQLQLAQGGGASKPIRVMFDSASTTMYGNDTRVSVGQAVTVVAASGASISLTSSPAWPFLGTVSLVGSNGLYGPTSPPVQPNFDTASIAINDIGNESGQFIAAIQVGGNGNMSLSDLAATLQTASPGWSFIVNPGSISRIPDPQSGTWSLEAICNNPTVAGGNDYFNLDVSSTGYTITAVSAIPEPASLGLLMGAASFMTLRPRRTRKLSR